MTRSTVSGRMTPFVLIWVGETSSAFGWGLTAFALGIQVYLTTGSATGFGLVLFCAAAPMAIAPRAGGLVERWSRRGVMITSGAAAGVATVATLVLSRREPLSIWPLCLAMVVIAFARAFQDLAFSASTPLLAAGKLGGPAAVMTQVGQAAAGVLAPLAAALLLVTIGLPGVLLIALAAFFVALLSPLPVRIPQPPPSPVAGRGSPRAETLAAWSWVKQHPGLVALMVLVAGVNFAVGMVEVALVPLVLGFAEVPALGVVLAIAFAGLALGYGLMGGWGGPRRRIAAIFATLTIQGLLLLVAGWRQSVAVVAAVAFVFLLGKAIVISFSLGIWQSKLSPDLEGAVTALRRLIIALSLPLGNLIAGPLVEYVFEPLLVAGGPLVATVGPFIGIGSGRGSGLLLITLGALILLAVPVAHRYPRLRKVESEIPNLAP